MHNITILAVGSLKQKFFKEAAEEYLKRIKSFCKLEIIELKAESFSPKDSLKVKKIESDRILEYLNKKKDAHVIVCDESGKQLSSPKLAQYLERINKRIILVIGGSLGLTDEVRQKADLVWSFSELTFPHELARVMLTEQLYRAITLNKEMNYHN